MDDEKNRRSSAVERADREFERKESTKLLRARIEYHRALIEQERARRELPLWRRLLSR
jgi:hypothetical protein